MNEAASSFRQNSAPHTSGDLRRRVVWRIVLCSLLFVPAMLARELVIEPRLVTALIRNAPLTVILVTAGTAFVIAELRRSLRLRSPLLLPPISVVLVVAAFYFGRQYASQRLRSPTTILEDFRTVPAESSLPQP